MKKKFRKAAKRIQNWYIWISERNRKDPPLSYFMEQTANRIRDMINQARTNEHLNNTFEYLEDFRASLPKSAQATATYDSLFLQLQNKERMLNINQ